MLATIQQKILFSHLLPKHRTLKRSLQPTEEELMKSYNIELCDRYSSPNIIGQVLMKDKRRAQWVACTAPVKMHAKFQP